VIAHRLSTIKTANNIVVMSNGTIVESGTHDELLGKEGAYYNLVEAQRISAESEEKAAQIYDGPHVDDDEKLRLTLSRSETKSRRGNAVDPDDSNNISKLSRTGTAKSKSSIALENRAPAEKPKFSLWELIKLTASFNKTEKFYMCLGLFFSIIAGGGYPTQAVLFAKSIVAISRPPSEYGKLREEANFWSGMYLMLAVVQLITYLSQGLLFGYCSERLVHRARDSAFRTIMRQDISFFDREENSTGALTSFLSTETTHLSGMSGVTLGTLLNVTTTLVAAIALGCAIGWKLALVCTATIPVLLACGMLNKFAFSRLEQLGWYLLLRCQVSSGFGCLRNSSGGVRRRISIRQASPVKPRRPSARLPV
jgi:ATP-binding cassette subfamily B (MDR/TAP) protein 1